MDKQTRNNRERDPSPPSLLIAAHCSTIRRKTERLDTNELSAILDDLVRELNSSPLRLTTYLNSLNEAVKTLNATFPSALLKIPSHYFFTLVRNRIRSLLEQLCTTNRLSDQEVYVLRNCAILIHDLVERVDDVSKLLHWVTDSTFLDSLGNCLNHTNRLLKPNQNRNIIKQITRLLSLFCNIQERLPLPLHQTLFERLLQPTINCLISTNYVKLFQNLKCDASRLTEEQKLFLIRCPHFLTSYNGPFIERLIEQILDKMLPRYVSILNKHMKGVKEWHRPMMRAVHNLIITIIYAEDYFSTHVKNEPFRLLMDHLLQLLNEPTMISKIQVETKNMESLLVDATLIVFSILVYESDALEYMKQRNAAETFRKLTVVPSETIVLNSYMLLAYTMSDNDIRTSQDDLPKLLSTTVSLLDKTIKTREDASISQNINPESIDRNILQLVETLKGLSQHEQIKTEIINQGFIPVFYEYYEKLFGLSREVMLEFIWSLSFNEQIAQLLREHPHFISSLHSIPRLVDPNHQQNTIRRSHSYSSLRNSGFTVSNEATSNGIRKMADGILWKLIKESQFRKALADRAQRPTDAATTAENQKNRYDILISYSYMDKETVYRIQQYLTDHGNHVWLDRSYNHRKGMEVVAEAIENSDIVLLCLSDSYKRDNHSRIEAEYAYNSKRTLFALTLRPGFKADGWLAPIFNSSIQFDFATMEFKAATKAILKEMKNQQQKRKAAEAKPKAPSTTSATQNPPILLPVVDKPQGAVGFPRTNIVNSFATATHQPSGPTRQQQQQQHHHQQQQQQPTPMTRYPHGAAAPPPTSVPNPTLYAINKQQRLDVPMQFVSRSSTFGSLGSLASGPFDKDQQQMSMRSLSRSPTLGSMNTTPFADGNDYEHSTIPKYPISRSSTPGSVGYGYYNKEQQTPMRSPSQSPTPGSTSTTAPTVIHRQQKHQSRHSEAPGQSISRSSTPGSAASVAAGLLDKGPPDTTVRSASRSPAHAANSSAMPTLVNKSYQQQKESHMRSLSQSPGLVPNPSAKDQLINEAYRGQQRQTPVRSLSASPVLSFFAAQPPPPAIADKQQPPAPLQPLSIPLSQVGNASMSSNNTDQRQPTTLTSVSQLPTPASGQSANSFVYDKQPQAPESLYSSRQPSMTTSTSSARHPEDRDQQQPQQPKESTSKSPAPGNSPGDESQHAEKRQQLSGQSNSRSALDNVASTALSNTAAPQQQQQPPQSLTNGTIRSRTSMNGDTQRQAAQIQTLSRSSSSDSGSSETSDTMDQMKTTRDQVSQVSTRNAIPSGKPSTAGVRQQQQPPPPPSLSQQQNPQIPLYPALLSTIDGITPSTALNGNDKHRPQTQMRSFAQAIPGSVPSSPSAIIDGQLLQTSTQPFLSSAATYAASAVNFVAFDRQLQQQQQQHTHRHPHFQAFSNGMVSTAVPSGFDKRLPPAAFAGAQAFNNGARPANVLVADARQNQQRRILPIPRSATFDSIPSVTGNQQQYQQQMQRNPDPRPLAYYNAIYASAPIVAEIPPRAPNGRLVQRSAQPNTLPPVPLNTANRQQQPQQHQQHYQQQMMAQTNGQPTGLPPMRSATLTTDNKQQRQQPVMPYAISQSPTSETLLSVPFANTNKQQEQDVVQSVSQSSTFGSNSVSTSISMSSSTTDGGKKSESSTLAKVNSRPTSPVTLPIPSTLKTVIPTVTNSVVRSQISLPEEYTNRKTDNSSYRTLSINAWRHNDVLDFLSDLNLYQMMPLCEAMSGKALTRLFRMCQSKPSRLYDQLNDELRVRFKGLTLPMGVYTQFLIEMDGLVGPTPDSLLSISPPRPNIVERVILASRSLQPQSKNEQPTSQLSTDPQDSHQALTSITPSEANSRATTPVSTRIVERAVFRPASSVGRPYDFIVESVEESTEILQQVARYGTEILQLEELAPHHHEEDNSFE